MNPFLLVWLAFLIYGVHVGLLRSPRYNRWYLRKVRNQRALRHYLDSVERL